MILKRLFIIGLLLIIPSQASIGAGFNPTCFGRGSTIRGDASSETIFGGEGRNVIRGGKGDDRIFAGAGRDFVCGNKGDDVLFGGEGFDRINGGRGFDLCDGEVIKNCERRPQDGL